MDPAPTDLDESDLLADLNAPQREAVLHDRGPLLVLAGAGSGKTRVITRRVAYLVRERGVAPWRILAVTFTNKAAREMKTRLEQLLGLAARDLNVATFHSAAAVILRREHEAAGLDRNFVIYDESDQLQVAKRAVREVGVDPSSVNARDLLGRIDQEKNAGRLPDQMKVGQDPRAQTAQRVYRKYQQLLRAAGALDFGDLLLLLVDLLRRNLDVRSKYQRRFQHVLVDEFQDTNPVQYELLRLFAPPDQPNNLVVVGDDDQSIYSWRGAEVDNILGFPTDYPGTQVVKLEQNYRSDQNILEAAHAVISKNRRRMAKKLWSQRPHGERLSLLIHRDERAEAQDVARRASDLRLEGVCDYDQVAVFYRTNAQSRVLEEAFRLARVPYAVISGRSFYDRAEIRDAAAYLRLMVNPRSDQDLLRVINTPARGIGDTTVERLADHAAALGVSLHEALARPEEVPSLNQGAIKRLRGFRALVDDLVAFAGQATTATAPAQKMLEATGLVSSHLDDGNTESLARAENLRELLSATQEFDKQRALALEQAAQAPPPEPGAEPLAVATTPLQGFLEQVSLVGDADGEAGEGRVSLMTLHAAKGLEYDAVFLTGMEEEVFPHRRATGPEGSEDEMAEERRLCYVGFTRARRRLHCSLAQSRTLFGELRFNAPSRFLSDVPRELFDFPDEPPAAAPRYVGPTVRRAAPRDDDDGPSVDRSYSQDSSDFGEGDVRGMKVRHEQFGLGVVVDVRGFGPGAKLTVRFDRVGLKTVIPRFLQPA